jgi:GNAT superfamily N-acetyltransferase
MSAIRVITPADIPAAMHLKEAAGWNQTEQDWRYLLQLAPDGCFGIDVDGVLVATTTAVCFGSGLAWIGMVLTDPEKRGQGLARRLMEHALAYLEGRAEWIKLDATDMGRPLYEKLGFEEECKVERWSRPGDPNTVRLGLNSGVGFSLRGTSVPLSERIQHLDRQAFGADRRGLLRLLAEIESDATDQGYAMARPGSKATYFGPCVAATKEAAIQLIDEFLEAHPEEPIYWDLLPHNEAAASLATERGFQPLRKLARMAIPRPTPFAHDDSKIYAIAGFEYG